MNKYAISFIHTNLPESISDSPFCLSSGKYASTVFANNMQEAKKRAVEIAKKDNFYNAGWKANIILLNKNGTIKSIMRAITPADILCNRDDIEQFINLND